MAVIDLSRRSADGSKLHELIPQFARACRGGIDCFFCHHPMTSPGIYWTGATGEIWLHPACVLELTIRLFHDVHEIECQSNFYLTAHRGKDSDRDPLLDLLRAQGLAP